MPDEKDKPLFDAIWRALIMVVKAFGVRYGYCKDIEIIK